MYQSLLLSTGGGIISNAQKSKQDDAPVLVIGVGGTGAKALDTLKKKVYKQLEADDPDATVPSYNHIRFLEIDSDAEWMEGTNLNNAQEFLNLQDPQIRGKFNNDITRNDMLKKPQFQWLEAEDIRIPESLHGAGGVRQLGRYMVINSSQSVYTKIKTGISNAISNRKANDLVIHIMAGISGGMGSGCFLDVCYIVRKVLDDLAASAAVVFGYFFLPDVITTIPDIAAFDNKITANYRNGYAALTELNYLMNLKENHGRFTQNYGNFSIDTDMPPVDMCHLVSALDASGNQRADGFKYCMNVAADYIMSYLSKPEGKDAITPKGNLANVNMGIDLLPVMKGGYNRYHILGASNAEMPMRQVATYLATGLYGQMRGYLRKMPVDQDVDNFSGKTLKLSIPELKRLLAKDVKLSREVPCPEASTIKGITASHVHAESILKPMTDWLYQQEGTVERNYQGLDTEEKIYRRNANATSLAGILFNSLADLCVDENYGPCYAVGMLKRTGKDLNSVLQGLHLEADKLCREAERQADFQSEQAEEAKQAFTSSKNTLLNRHVEKDAYDAYRGALGIWYRRKLDVAMYRYVDKLILGLQKKADDMYKRYFGKLKDFLDELDQTFGENQTYFDGGHGDDPSDDGFTMRIMKFSDMQAHLDSILMDEKPADAAANMIAYFMDNADEWLSGEEYRITRLVNGFVSSRFKEEMSKSMQEYLKEKYPGMDAGQREQALLQDLFEPLIHASEPLFWCSSAVNTEDTYSSINLSYPESASDIASAAREFKTIHPEAALRGCSIGDRTFMLRLYSGMPLYGYHGLELMKRRYDGCDKAGVHLYGNGGTDWKTLPTPIPYSLNPNEVENGVAVESAFYRGREIGLVKMEIEGTEGNKDFCIIKQPILNDKVALELLSDLRCIGRNRVENDNALEQIVMQMVKEKYLTEDGELSQSRIGDWEQRIKKLKEDIKMGEFREYQAAHHRSEKIAIDNIIMSPVMSKVLLDAVELYNGVETAIRRLERFKDDDDTVKLELNNFCNALFTGILQQGIGKIFFTYVERHTEREAVLASKSMPFSRYLYYQAFCSYKELEDSIKQDINSQTKEKIDNLQEGDDAIALKIKEKYTPKYMAELEGMYRKEKENEEIRAFYNKFADLLFDYVEQFM